jgi:methylmalonyl-CoA mutase cobalamin-binding subunit
MTLERGNIGSAVTSTLLSDGGFAVVSGALSEALTDWIGSAVANARPGTCGFCMDGGERSHALTDGIGSAATMERRGGSAAGNTISGEYVQDLAANVAAVPWL